MLGYILFAYFLETGRLSRLIICIVCSVIYFVLFFDILYYSNKCPNCFGSDFCLHFESNELQITALSTLIGIFNSKVTKSVFYGYLNDEILVLKRIDIDKASERNFLLANESNILVHITNQIQNNKQYYENKNVVLCPHLENIHILFGMEYENLNEFLKNNRLWIDFDKSIEPILLKLFSTDKIWPVPQYYGACNNIIIEEYKGENLVSAHSLPWKTRAFLAVQILRMAKIFTFHHPIFAFYMTDFSLDNLAVDSSGFVTMIDLENVVIVDRNMSSIGNEAPWKDIHVSEIFHENQFSFSYQDICNHHTSDHNYYSVCNHILLHSDVMDGGLLRDIPFSILETYPKLGHLLKECSKPEKYESRISAGQELETLLQHIVKDFVWE